MKIRNLIFIGSGILIVVIIALVLFNQNATNDEKRYHF